jgi:Ca2+-binding RTX toxin-like protein
MGGGYATNDLPGCPKGGLLLGTDGPNTGIDSPMQDCLYGGDGEDEVRGLGANDELWGGLGGDVIYGGPGFDIMWAGPVHGRDTSMNKLYGGDRTDDMFGAHGEDVLHGGAGNDTLGAASYKGDLGADKLYCGAGTDKYIAGRLVYVSSSCEVKQKPAKPKKGRAVPL